MKETEIQNTSETSKAEVQNSPHRIKQGNIEKQQKQPFLLS